MDLSNAAVQGDPLDMELSLQRNCQGTVMKCAYHAKGKKIHGIIRPEEDPMRQKKSVYTEIQLMQSYLLSKSQMD